MDCGVMSAPAGWARLLKVECHVCNYPNAQLLFVPGLLGGRAPDCKRSPKHRGLRGGRARGKGGRGEGGAGVGRRVGALSALQHPLKKNNIVGLRKT